MEEIIVNRVAESDLETIDLEKFFPAGEVVVFDLKDHLYMELILKEKEYRQNLKNIDWSHYDGKNVCLTCSVDAIIPLWAFMLAMSYLEPVAKEVFLGDEKFLNDILLMRNLWKIDSSQYEGKRVVVKGCGEKPVPAIAYAEITKILRPVAKSIMYGEPCSTVPIFKKK
jgi:hypothetical protein